MQLRNVLWTVFSIEKMIGEHSLYSMFIKTNIYLPFDVKIPTQNYALPIYAFCWWVLKSHKIYNILHLRRFQGLFLVLAFEIHFCSLSHFLFLLLFEKNLIQ